MSLSPILFGTAGIPISSRKQDTLSGIERVKELSLQAMELEFVHGVRMKQQQAMEVKRAAEKNGIVLSVHAPYYINLNAVEREKREASRQRIIDSAIIGHTAGAKAVCFHAAYFQGMPRTRVFEGVKKELEKIIEETEKQEIACKIKPETTGKPTQFGSLTELLEIYNETDLQPYIDFAHLHARENGRFKEREDVKKAFEEIEKTEKKLLKELNIHMSGINYGEKGEKNHLTLEEKANDFNYKWVLECLKEFDCKGTVICESPNIELDAMLMKKVFESI